VPHLTLGAQAGHHRLVGAAVAAVLLAMVLVCLALAVPGVMVLSTLLPALAGVAVVGALIILIRLLLVWLAGMAARMVAVAVALDIVKMQTHGPQAVTARADLLS
jgi:hypothetical protein